MNNFLVEVPHNGDKIACMKAMQIFIDSGSHFLANADWGCADNEHKAWMIVEAENKEQAMLIVPPYYRARAKIIQLFKVTQEEVEKYRKEHKLTENENYHS